MRDFLSLNGTWVLKEALGRTNIPAKVPGSVLEALLAAGLTPDPFDRENEYAALRLFDRDYTFKTTFAVPEDVLSREMIDLVFWGLDTLAEVTLNGEPILTADNMHRTWRVAVKHLLRPVDNRLSVTLRSPNQFIAKAAQENPDITYDGSGSVMGTSALRKAHYMFGWDWGPQLPDAGIWRPCGLEAYDALRMDSVDIRQHHGENAVRLDMTAQTQGDAPHALRVRLTAPDGAVSEHRAAGDALSITVEKPRLWQPRGWGEQALYTLEISLVDQADEPLDQTTRRIGLRTVEVSQQPDAWGSEFCFKVNGHKIFSMGADYIPEDNLLGRTSPERTRRLLMDCAEANFNTIRVWGGGYYPEDWFFDLCDELGLMVWLDLMYACNIYKLTEAFEASILAETRDNLLRVRHHASICVICGNNEMEAGWCDWPAVVSHSAALKADYIKQFEYVLQKASAQYAPQLPYWPSSPSSGGSFDDPNSYDRGDVHCWDVWHGLKPFEDYREKFPRYCSEFGFESFPSLKTVSAYTLPEDRNIFSRVMESHQKCVGGNGKILYYLSQNYRYPMTFAHVLYASQLLQAEAMRAGVEHWRRYRGRCMGAIYWQLNDCWPVASWASIDSFGRWKALHYAAKRFFAPVLISGERKGKALRVNVTNETLETFRGKAEVRLITAGGKPIRTETLFVDIAPLTAAWVYTLTDEPEGSELHPQDDVACILRLTDEEGRAVSENCELYSQPKFMRFAKPAITWQVRQQGADALLTLRCDAFAWGVWLDTDTADCRFSDNSFFLLPDEEKQIIVQGASAETIERELSITSIWDLGREES